ncbi:DJ-1/PfpI family protein [Cognatiyoonia sp. IB215446]|uniref:DJ-1/PfpI family protein n=1 Tax=Cognatiyoonia sp. IB215446 TaxID=3097355 RepID=UPI002A0C1EE6|nr:DJ-1/PfpI family protein [Cognatiyoonia sp. IB215446]MDX8350481.1 DJ-1/PfpI family protein [Cognatiyoonia sp. IB215446]
MMKNLAVFIFPGIQTLDLFGPIELLGGFRDKIALTMVAETMEPVPTRHGQRILPDATIHHGTEYDLLLIPGGDSALDVPKNAEAMDWLKSTSTQADYVLTLCTGSILLAMTGVLDGKRATTNKQDFNDTVHLGPNVTWVKKARWVEDDKFFTSSGVSAGMDMSLAIAQHLFGTEAAEWMAEGSEYEWHRDAAWDPFAEKAGLLAS